jgi:DNA-binding response OmpR family regulator
MKLESKTVLVIDDQYETLDLLKLTLESNGFTALTAANWQEVVYLVERTHNLKRSIDVVLLDLMMPDRSGFDIYRALEVMLVPMPPVVMLSAVTGLQQQLEARDLGITKYLTKPTTPAKLIASLREVLSRQVK